MESFIRFVRNLFDIKRRHPIVYGVLGNVLEVGLVVIVAGLAAIVLLPYYLGVLVHATHWGWSDGNDTHAATRGWPWPVGW